MAVALFLGDGGEAADLVSALVVGADGHGGWEGAVPRAVGGGVGRPAGLAAGGVGCAVQDAGVDVGVRACLAGEVGEREAGAARAAGKRWSGRRRNGAAIVGRARARPCRTPPPFSLWTTRRPSRSSSRTRSSATAIASFPHATATRRSGASASQPVDLVVLDLVLPHLDGLEVCKRLRATSPRADHHPHGARRRGGQGLGLELGADDYITKPFSIREFRSRVKAVLRRASAPEPRGGGLERRSRSTVSVVVLRGVTVEPERRPSS